MQIFSQKNVTQYNFYLRNRQKSSNFARKNQCSTLKLITIMAKRIEFIAPVEAMRGNLSGSQTLEYPLNDNPAYDAPAGKHYATNYQPRFIGAKRASDGLKYFAVKTRSAINKTAASTQAMAVLGAGGAIVGAILANKTSAMYIAIENLYVETKPKRNGKLISLRAWLSESIMYGLRNKMQAFSWTGLEQGVPTVITVLNPFVKSEYQADYTVTISNEVLVKFWNALANNPIVFTVAGQTGVAHSGDTFGSVVDGSYNVLQIVKEGTNIYADAEMTLAIGLSDDSPVETTTSIQANGQYITFPFGG